MKTYKPPRNIAIGYAQERIVKHLKEHGEATGNELYKLSSKKSKPLSQLIEKGIVYRKNKKYKLFKTEYDELFQEFLTDIALDLFVQSEKSDITALDEKDLKLMGVSQETLDTWKELIPDFLKDLLSRSIENQVKA